MCFGKSKSSAPPPAPAAAPPNPNNVADNSNVAQRQAVIASQTQAPASFGSELGSAMPG